MSYNYDDISNYKFKDTIGEGTFGKVKKSLFVPSNEYFAIKILNKEKIKEKMGEVQFNEIDIIKKFNHLNVVYVYRILEDIKNYYIIMEYCSKGELFDYIVEKERLTEEEGAKFFFQLINGIEYIHSKGIAHRDLKPENLLLDDNYYLKIIDFGLSNFFDGTHKLKTKCGSPSYASPELITESTYDGFKNDIWCCGIILYVLLCGYLPFEGNDNDELFQNILECDPEFPENLNFEYQRLIKKFLTVDPNKRITIDKIKKSSFYLKGKDLMGIEYEIKKEQVINNRYKLFTGRNHFSLNNKRTFHFISNSDLLTIKNAIPNFNNNNSNINTNQNENIKTDFNKIKYTLSQGCSKKKIKLNNFISPKYKTKNIFNILKTNPINFKHKRNKTLNNANSSKKYQMSDYRANNNNNYNITNLKFNSANDSKKNINLININFPFRIKTQRNSKIVSLSPSGKKILFLDKNYLYFNNIFNRNKKVIKSNKNIFKTKQFNNNYINNYNNNNNHNNNEKFKINLNVITEGKGSRLQKIINNIPKSRNNNNKKNLHIQISKMSGISNTNDDNFIITHFKNNKFRLTESILPKLKQHI